MNNILKPCKFNNCLLKKKCIECNREQYICPYCKNKEKIFTLIRTQNMRHWRFGCGEFQSSGIKVLDNFKYIE